jgi:hypothetical protein
VDHAYTATEPVTPWRTAAIVAAAVAAVELFVLILVGVVLGAKLITDKAETIVAQTQASRSDAPPPAAAETEPKAKGEPSAAVAELTRARTSVIVLNGNGIPAAASVAAEQVRKLDYVIAGTANAPRSDFQRSVIMFRPGFKGEAIRLAKDLKVKRVTPLDGVTRRDLQGAHIAYIIGS